MTLAEAAALLAIAAAFDNRRPDADAAAAWALALDGLRFVDCRQVVVEHYRRSTDWIMPSHVVTGVRRLRDKRIADHGPIQPPPGLNPDDFRAYQGWLVATTRAVADGDVTAAGELAWDGPPRDVVADLGQVGQEIR